MACLTCPTCRTAKLERPPAYTVAGGLNFDASLVDPDEEPQERKPILELPVTEGGRNDHLKSLVGKWANESIPRGEIMQRAFDWNAKNHPPMSTDEVMKTVMSVINTIENNGQIVPVTSEGAGRTTAKLEEVPIYDAFALMDDPRKLPPYLINGLFRQGDNVVLAGPPKSMKSFLQAELIYSIAWGEDFLTDFEVESEGKPVVWIQAEMPWYETQRRKTLAFDEHGVEYLIDELLKRLDGEIPAVLAVDSLASVFAEDNENDNADMQFFLRNRLGRFREVFGDDLTIVLLHHSNKGKVADLRKDPFNSLRGASALRGWYSAGMVMFKENPVDQHAEIHFEMRGEMPIEQINVELQNGQLRRFEKPDVDSDAMVMSSYEQEFLNAVKVFEKDGRPLTTAKTGGGPFAPREITLFKKVKKGTAFNKRLRVYEEAMHNLIDQGKLEVVDMSSKRGGLSRQLFIADSNKNEEA